MKSKKLVRLEYLMEGKLNLISIKSKFLMSSESWEWLFKGRVKLVPDKLVPDEFQVDFFDRNKGSSVALTITLLWIIKNDFARAHIYDLTRKVAALTETLPGSFAPWSTSPRGWTDADTPAPRTDFRFWPWGGWRGRLDRRVQVKKKKKIEVGGKRK